MNQSQEEKIIDNIKNEKISLKEILYRLFFTRDDSLDLLQLFFLVLIGFFMVAFSLDSMGKWNVKSAAWTIFGTVFATLAIAGTPTWIAQLLANKKAEDGEIVLSDNEEEKG